MLLVVAAAWPEAEEDAEAPATHTCPDYVEEITFEARVCRFCGSRLEPPVPAPLPDPAELAEPLPILEEAADPGRVHLLVQKTDPPEARKRLVARLAPYFPGKTPAEIERNLTIPYLIPQRVSREAALAIQRKWQTVGIRVEVVAAELVKSDTT